MAKFTDSQIAAAVAAAQKGDFNSLALYYLSIGSKVRNFLQTFVKNEETAADFVADVYIRAQQNINSYDSSCKLQTWIYTIARNVAIDYLRKNKGVEQVSINENGLCFVDLSTEKTTENLGLHVILNELVDELPEKYSTMLRLRYWRGLRIEEIAAEMNIPEGTVKGTMHRLQNQLAKKVIPISGRSYNPNRKAKVKSKTKVKVTA